MGSRSHALMARWQDTECKLAKNVEKPPASLELPRELRKRENLTVCMLSTLREGMIGTWACTQASTAEIVWHEILLAWDAAKPQK